MLVAPSSSFLRAVQLQPANLNEFYNSPIAMINTKLLVPGYDRPNGPFRIPNFVADANTTPIGNPRDLQPARCATYDQFSISSETTGGSVNASYQQVQWCAAVPDVRVVVVIRLCVAVDPL